MQSMFNAFPLYKNDEVRVRIILIMSLEKQHHVIFESCCCIILCDNTLTLFSEMEFEEATERVLITLGFGYTLKMLKVLSSTNSNSAKIIRLESSQK